VALRFLNTEMVTYGAIPEAERSSRARAAPMLALMGLAVVAVVAIVTLSTQSRAVEMVSFPQDDLGILKEMVSKRGCGWGAATGVHAGRAGHVRPPGLWSARCLSVVRRGGDVLEQNGASACARLVPHCRLRLGGCAAQRKHAAVPQTTLLWRCQQQRGGALMVRDVRSKTWLALCPRCKLPTQLPPPSSPCPSSTPG